jgi:hypothetical protein
MVAGRGGVSTVSHSCLISQESMARALDTVKMRLSVKGCVSVYDMGWDGSVAAEVATLMVDRS